MIDVNKIAETLAEDYDKQLVSEEFIKKEITHFIKRLDEYVNIKERILSYSEIISELQLHAKNAKKAYIENKTLQNPPINHPSKQEEAEENFDSELTVRFTGELIKYYENVEKEENKITSDEVELNIQNIPKFNLAERYFMLDSIESIDLIDSLARLNIKQESKHKVLALILGISPDNAKHLTNGTYKPISDKSKEKVEDFLNHIGL